MDTPKRSPPCTRAWTWLRISDMRTLKPIVFALCLVPLAWLVWLAGSGGLGANPIEAVNRYLGDWALRFLLIALTVTPLRDVTGWAGWVRLRRMLGLFAFAYAFLHVSSYVGLDQFFAWPEIWADIVKRRYITVGLLVFTILAVLAATSPKSMVKRLGGRRWKKLHTLAYIAGIGAVFHYFMMIKADLLLPSIHAAILAALLGWRLAGRLKRRTRSKATRRGPSVQTV